MTYTLHHGDCLDVLRTMPDNSVDAIVTDPPYGLSNTAPDKVADTIVRWASGDRDHVPAGRGFMGRPWDAFVPPPAVWDECLRVLKPGGHMAVFAGSRTQDLMGLSIRLAGFEIRDSLAWITGSGFPKSLDVSKAIDKAHGAEPVDTGVPSGRHGGGVVGNGSSYEVNPKVPNITAPATPEALRWSGWGTALKPAQEPILLARKPLVGTVAANVMEWGTGALNIDASRVAASDKAKFPAGAVSETEAIYGGGGGMYANRPRPADSNPSGRWPANVLLDPDAAEAMDEQSGHLHAAGNKAKGKGGTYDNSSYAMHYDGIENRAYHDSGGASRFFPVFKYQAKAPKRERPVIERPDGSKVQHPTVKPLALMSWLVTLITPPGGTVLDPFAGSGTTLQAARDKGFHGIGIEADPDHCDLIRKRLDDDGLLAA